MLLGNEEIIVLFKDFPWFKEASAAEVLKVEWPGPSHFYWLVDLAVESIKHPENFPLIFRLARQCRRR
ncbi:MAG: DUF2442 domain-containing protein [Nitrospira sp. LK265]|nr:DUF2442 domain-containing protein [Nitrospira sp. LK265]